MARRPKAKGGVSPARTVADAVEIALDMTGEVKAPARAILSNRRSGVRTVFSASRKAVAGAKPGNVDGATLEAALMAAADAIGKSGIPKTYERIHTHVGYVPDSLVRMAALQAAGDAQAGMALGRRGKGLPDRISNAAVEAAEARTRRGDGVRAAAAASESARRHAEAASTLTSNIVMTMVPFHAAAVAAFEVGIRGATQRNLQDAVRETCSRLPESARHLGESAVSITTALSEFILRAAANRRLHSTAMRSVEEACVDETIDRIVGMVDENTFEAVYGALAACAHAASGGRAFESGYEEALAAACGVDTGSRMGSLPDRLSPDAINDILKDMPPDMAGQVRESDLQAFYQQMHSKMGLLFGSKDDMARRKRLGTALDVDYKKAAADPALAGMISLYKMAYDAGYEAAASKRRR